GVSPGTARRRVIRGGDPDPTASSARRRRRQRLGVPGAAYFCYPPPNRGHRRDRPRLHGRLPGARETGAARLARGAGARAMRRRSGGLMLALLTAALFPGSASAHRLEAEAIIRPHKVIQVESWFETGETPRSAKVAVYRADGGTLSEGRLDDKG